MFGWSGAANSTFFVVCFCDSTSEGAAYSWRVQVRPFSYARRPCYDISTRGACRASRGNISSAFVTRPVHPREMVLPPTALEVKHFAPYQFRIWCSNRNRDRGAVCSASWLERSMDSNCMTCGFSNLDSIQELAKERRQ